MGLLLLSSLLCGAPVHRNYVYAKMLRDGVAPTWADFAFDFDLDRAQAEAALDKLAHDHDVVLLPSGSGAASRSYILMSHPFSNLPTAHRANHDRDAVVAAFTKLARAVPQLQLRTFLKLPNTKQYGNWYWDLMGQHVMLGGAPSEIRSVCHRSGRLISQTVVEGRVTRSSPPSPIVCFCAPLRQWYEDLVSTWHDKLLCFSEEQQLDAWLEESGLGEMPQSYHVVSSEQLLALSHLFFGGRAEPDFVRRDRQAIRRALDDAGLTGDFWELPA